MAKNNIIPQMFDVRPVNKTGDLDWEKIQKIEKNLLLEVKELKKEMADKTYVEMIDMRPQKNLREEVLEELENIKQQEEIDPYADINWESRRVSRSPMKASVFQFGKKVNSNNIPFFHESDFIPERKNEPIEIQQEEIVEEKNQIPEFSFEKEEEYQNEPSYQNFLEKEFEKETEEIKYDKRKSEKIQWDFSFSDLFTPAKFSFNFQPRKTALNFAALSLLVAILMGGFALGVKGIGIKGKVLGTSEEGYSNLNSAISEIKSQNFDASEMSFEKSYEKFSESSREIDEMGNVIIEISKFFPFSSKLSSGKNLVEAGKHISIAGKSLNKIMKVTSTLKNPLEKSENQNVSLLELFRTAKKEMVTIDSELKKTKEYLDEVNIEDLPEDKQKQFISLKEKLPTITKVTNDFLDNSEVFVDLLGGNGPRKYLFLFQNNQEMRATGGFIGSYGLMDISNGRIRNFFIDGIFNPDGQLQDKIIPPKPIQKISAAWSLHDSNWFPNFPASAKEAISFYEKTGGPTADGVIALTPTVMQKLLAITGPIEMEEYGITVDADNFIEKTQQEVEVNYDKEENKPKKILSDLAPIILDKIFNTRDAKSISMTIQALSSGLSEKHILLYSENNYLQKVISQKGWSGEILSTQKDYLSVINSNINGFKTDGIIDEEISHEAEIGSDGSVVDTVTITRHHNGGNSNYEWWNKVNADYMRIYVPLGSKLLDVSGQTRETNNPPLDYDALKFKKDPQVEKEEQGITIDENSGTRVYEDSGKTVFGNWTYVSPQETMTIKYKYILPFKVNVDDNLVNSYSILVQKQSGSLGSKFESNIKFPKNYNVEWNYPEDIRSNNDSYKIETKLDIDKFIGLVFTKSKAILND